MELKLTTSVSIVGDDVLFQMLSSGKRLLRAKDFKAALKLFETAKLHCQRNNWPPSMVDEEVARALVGLGRETEAIELLERHLHRQGAGNIFERLIKVHCDIGKAHLAQGHEGEALAAYNKALGIAHLYYELGKLKPAGKFWCGDEYGVGAKSVIEDKRKRRGSIYGFTYATDGAPPENCLICSRDLKILFKLSFPDAS